jgi:hypothetical protein
VRELWEKGEIKVGKLERYCGENSGKILSVGVCEWVTVCVKYKLRKKLGLTVRNKRL